MRMCAGLKMLGPRGINNNDNFAVSSLPVCGCRIPRAWSHKSNEISNNRKRFVCCNSREDLTINKMKYKRKKEMTVVYSSEFIQVEKQTNIRAGKGNYTGIRYQMYLIFNCMSRLMFHLMYVRWTSYGDYMYGTQGKRTMQKDARTEIIASRGIIAKLHVISKI